MKVAKLTLWDGSVFYTDKVERVHISEAFTRAREQLGVDFTPTYRVQVDIIEMTPEEYQAIPATVESARLFGREHERSSAAASRASEMSDATLILSIKP